MASLKPWYKVVSPREDLREMIPALRPASIDFLCTNAERPAMQALVNSIRQDRRVIEAQH